MKTKNLLIGATITILVATSILVLKKLYKKLKLTNHFTNNGKVLRYDIVLPNGESSSFGVDVEAGKTITTPPAVTQKYWDAIKTEFNHNGTFANITMYKNGSEILKNSAMSFS